MHRLDLGLYSHPKEFFGGMEFEPMLTPREKSPLPENVPRGGSNPRRCGQRAQALPTELFQPQGHLNLYQNVEFSSIYHHTMFEPNWFLQNQTYDNATVLFFTQISSYLPRFTNSDTKAASEDELLQPHFRACMGLFNPFSPM